MFQKNERRKDQKKPPASTLKPMRALSDPPLSEQKHLQQELAEQRAVLIFKQGQRLRANQEILSKLHAEDRQLTEDRMRYTLRLEKFTKDLEEMKKNTGKPEYFLQFNQAAHYYVQQMILEQSSKEAHQEMRAGGEPDPDRMTYEQLLELGEKIGKVSKGLTAVELAGLKRTVYGRHKGGKADQCTICCQVYRPTDAMIVLPCQHAYHDECLTGWLKEQNICPLCKTRVI